ncbi:hypothetical protein [Micromonospora humida]|uniref:LysM domain-containing protein n=1 Tax=Micromonospora humida TaxID=2809018 RepID=A0ABS2ILU7_9ACTN|nr:hypothetical protein [Micromonospora humida]MBM7075253.1 hypothetical protein [Micromonospora humida]
MRFPTTTGTGRPVTRRFTGRSRRRGIVVTTAAVLAALLLAAAHAAGTVPDRESVHPAPSHAGSVATPPATHSADATPAGRYYVVGPPVGGQREYLYQIAATTLGDGNRYREVFELNRGRRQPDGGRLTDPAELRPGWVLALPPDARGPGVRIGPLPPTGADATPPATAGPGHTGQLVVLAGLAAAALLVATLLRRPPRRRRALPGRPVRLALAAGGTTPPLPHPSAGFAPSVDVDPPAGAAPPTETAPPTGAALPAGADPTVDGAPTAVPTGTPDPARPDPARGPSPMDPAAPGARADAAARPAPGHGVDVTDVSPVPDVDGDLDTEVTWPGGTLVVRVAAGGGRPHHAWQIPAQPRPSMRLPVRLGHRRGWALWVDLAGTSDVFTVTGPVEAARQRARTIAEQVHTAGHTVTVIGDLFGSDLPDGWVRRAAFPTGEADLPAGTGVLCSAALSGPELAFARRITALTGHRLVPIVVGRALRARWSVTVRPDAPAGPELVAAAPAGAAHGGRLPAGDGAP